MSVIFDGADSFSAPNTDRHSVHCWLVCQATRARFTLPAQIWWACSHLFIRSQSDLNGWHGKQSHIWAGSWKAACVDTPISVEPSVRPHLTQIWLPWRFPNRSNTWGWSHMKHNVCRAEDCVTDAIEGRYLFIYPIHQSERYTGRAKENKKKKGKTEREKAEMKTDTDSWSLSSCLDADRLWQLCFVRVLRCSLGLLGLRATEGSALVSAEMERCSRHVSLSFGCMQLWITASRPGLAAEGFI